MHSCRCDLCGKFVGKNSDTVTIDVYRRGDGWNEPDDCTFIENGCGHRGCVKKEKCYFYEIDTRDGIKGYYQFHYNDKGEKLNE